MTLPAAADAGLGIIIPTRNRPDWLQRQIAYYASVGFTGTLYFGDSSDPVEQKRVRDVMAQFDGRLRVKLVDCPGMNEMQAVAEAARQMEEPYAAVTGDDDFIIPETAVRCAAFLKEHSDYATAHGQAILCGFDSDERISSVTYATPYPLLANESETASHRLRTFFDAYCVLLFAVHRTSNLVRAATEAAAIPDPTFRELLTGALMAIDGKSHKVAGLYLIRGNHMRRFKQPDMFDWVVGSSFQSGFKQFRDCAVLRLMEREGMSAVEAGEAVKRVAWRYLGLNLPRKWSGVYSPSASRRSELGRRLPRIRKAWDTFRQFVPTEPHRLSLKALQRPSSPYHQSFMRFQRSITSVR